MMPYYYVVYRGKVPGVYAYWVHMDRTLSTKEQIKDFPGAHYERFDSQKEAETAYASFLNSNTRKDEDHA